jgi:RHS repeat-associated protein
LVGRHGDRTQSFGYDAVGNWTSVTTNGSTQTRSANMQNEYTSVSGASTPTYDANGNMLSDETGKQYVYDAWNRLKVVKNSSGTTLVTYHYDARNYRIAEVVGSDTRSLYYSSQWQVLEERVNGTARVSNVWSAVYVDALIARDRDAENNGSLEERLYVTHDANFNTTALLNTSGAVVEKYAYDPYGAVTVYNASNTVLGSSAYAMRYLHQGGRLSAESGLYYFRNRDYSTSLGRWVSLDPIRFSAGDVNLYRYVGNNSINGLDPWGLFPPDHKFDPPEVRFPKKPKPIIADSIPTYFCQGVDINELRHVRKLPNGETLFFPDELSGKWRITLASGCDNDVPWYPGHSWIILEGLDNNNCKHKYTLDYLNCEQGLLGNGLNVNESINLQPISSRCFETSNVKLLNPGKEYAGITCARYAMKFWIKNGGPDRYALLPIVIMGAYSVGFFEQVFSLGMSFDGYFKPVEGTNTPHAKIGVKTFASCIAQDPSWKNNFNLSVYRQRDLTEKEKIMLNYDESMIKRYTSYIPAVIRYLFYDPLL